MGDSSEMTIEFLRARLLSERSVSRSARQRADQLAKRVLELEEQLRIVSVQRKKAEKAAADVLAILDREGLSEFSEVIDSSSDHDEILDQRDGSKSRAKEDRSSSASRDDRCEVDDGYSASEIEASGFQGEGRSLSWKRERNGSGSLDNKRVYQARQRSRNSHFIYSSESSARTYLGKSCRKIKRRDKQVSSDVHDGGSLETTDECHDRHGKEEALAVKDDPDDCLGSSGSKSFGASASGMDVLATTFPHSLDEEIEKVNADVNSYGFTKDEEMERALEKQAELIDRYQAEENAQREWEENNKNSYNAWEHNGILGDVSEDRIRMETFGFSDHKPCHDEEQRFGKSWIPLTEQRYHISSESGKNGKEENDSATCREPVTDGVVNSCSAISLNADPDGLTGKVTAGTTLEHVIDPRMGKASLSENCEIISNGGSSQSPLVGGFLESPPSKILSSDISDLKQVAPPQQPSIEQLHTTSKHGLEDVLDALQRAKLSLRQLCNMSVPSDSPKMTVADTHVMSIEQGNFPGIPISGGLFRLPMDPLPNSNQLRSGNYSFDFKASKLPPSNHNLLTARIGSYHHAASYSQLQSRFPERNWEVDSYRNSITRPFSHSGRDSHFHSDPSKLRSSSGNVFQKPYVNTQQDIYFRDHKAKSGSLNRDKLGFLGVQ